MNIINVEIFSILIVFSLIVDYYTKYKNNFDENSSVFFKLSFSIIIISFFNIIISTGIFSNNISNVLLLINYILLVFPPVLISIYVRKNFFNFKLTKYSKLLNVIFCAIYFILIITIFIKDFSRLSGYHNSYVNIGENNLFLLISLLPLIEKSIRHVIYIIKNKDFSSNRLFLVSLLPIIGVCMDIILKEYAFVGPSYTLSLLLLYIYRNTMTLNIDPLTGINNRRILSNIDSKNHSSTIMACYLFDIDKFKYINDTYGHKKGDVILKDVANILKNSIRKSDYAIRYGGDEFLVIAHIKSKTHKEVIANKIKNKIDEYNKVNEIKISLSVGYDIYCQENYKSFDEFIQKIDSNMYKNKMKKR